MQSKLSARVKKARIIGFRKQIPERCDACGIAGYVTLQWISYP
jgi:hypothetical protein